MENCSCHRHSNILSVQFLQSKLAAGYTLSLVEIKFHIIFSSTKEFRYKDGFGFVHLVILKDFELDRRIEIVGNQGRKCIVSPLIEHKALIFHRSFCRSLFHCVYCSSYDDFVSFNDGHRRRMTTK